MDIKIKNKIPHTHTHKMEYLGVNLIKRVEHSCWKLHNADENENKSTKNRERDTMFVDWKTQQSKDVDSTKPVI